jgi:hypothetical protein
MGDEARMKAAIALGREADMLAAAALRREDSAYARLIAERAEAKPAPLTRSPSRRHRRVKRSDDLLLEALRSWATC